MAAAASTLDLRTLLRSGVGVPVGVLAVLAMIVLPLPPIALDVLFTFNIALSLVIVMAVFYVARPLEFGVFPTVLLLATLLRLALNVASTRVVLLHGHTGSHAAGKVIESFGEFVIGGNYAVGVIVFAILTIINFVVVTKGSGRISERIPRSCRLASTLQLATGSFAPRTGIVIEAKCSSRAAASSIVPTSQSSPGWRSSKVEPSTPRGGTTASTWPASTSP